MDEKNYKLSVLPLFEDDLNKIVDYISISLQNPIAAEDFVDAVDGCRRYSAYKSLDFSGECLAHPIAFVPDDFLSERTCSGDSETGLFRFLRF